MRRLPAHVRLLAAGCVALSIAALPLCSAAAAEPDPVALLKESTALLEKLPAEYREQAKLPLAALECFVGDRELGRRYFADVVALVEKVPEGTQPFNLYGRVVEAQQMVGLIDDARSVIRKARAAERTLKDDDLILTELFMMQGHRFVDFYASIGDVEEALRYIDEMRPMKHTTAAGTEHERKTGRERARLALVFALLKYGNKEKAEAVLRRTIADFPGLDERTVDVGRAWLRFRRFPEAKKSIDSYLEKSDPSTYQVFVPAALANTAADYIDAGRPNDARLLLSVVQSLKGNDNRWQEFAIHAKLGEYDKAIAAADRPRKSADKGEIGLWDSFNNQERRSHFSALAVLATKVGKREEAEKYFAEVEKTLPEEDSPEAAGAWMDLGAHRMAAGDTTAMLKAAEELQNPIMTYMAKLVTAVEVHIRKTGKGVNVFQRPLAFE